MSVLERRRGRVQRISLAWVVDTVRAIDNLGAIKENDSLFDHWGALYNARSQLENVFDLSVYAWHLRVSRQKWGTFKEALDRLMNVPPTGSATLDLATRTIKQYEVWDLNRARSEFMTVLLSELITLPVFLVSQKEGYDLTVLIEAGTMLFPPSMLSKAPETQPDALEAGKALAFELPTACGFHVFRALESVLKRYWDKASNGTARPNLETMGNFAAELEKGKHGEAKVWEALKQMAKHHRNPLIHPEAILSVEEAIGTLGIARSVIGMMLDVLPDVPPTTANAVAAPATAA